MFPLGETTAWDGQRVNVFGNRPDPGVRAGIGYRSVRREDCWGAIPGADRAYAAAIFLHRHSYTSNGATRPTSGCVSVGDDELVEIVTRLDPMLDPHFAIGPTTWLRDTA